MIPEVGQRFGPYEILGRLGGGGMGLVFRAWDERLHREVAIKLRYERLEEGQKRIRISFVDSDGKGIMPTLDTTTQVQFPPGESSITSCLVLVLQQLKLPKFGEYSIDLAMDDRHEASIPLFVRQIQA